MVVRVLAQGDVARMAEIAHHGLEFDEVNEAVVREKTLGAKDCVADWCLGAEVGGRLAGFAVGCLGTLSDGKQKGHIRLMVVDPAFRRAGVGTALLLELESRMRARGVAAISTMDVPANYFMPGVDFRYTEAYCFLHKHGYRVAGENHNLLADVSVDAWPSLDSDVTDFAADGFDVRRARPEDGAAIHAFIGAHWPGWHAEADGALENAPCTMYVAMQAGRCLAFAGYQGNNKALNWFGPMGTDPATRGKGIGGVLLRLCLRDLARQGWRTAIIPWVGPIRFYARYCGAKLDRSFWVYAKELG